MKPIRLFHTTSESSADLIERNGFLSKACRAFPAGVWLSNYPLTSNEGAKGNVVFEVVLQSTPDELFYQYEVIEFGKPYREFILPDEVLNNPARCTFRRLNDDEIPSADKEKFWSEFPPGEPETTHAELDADSDDLEKGGD